MVVGNDQPVLPNKETRAAGFTHASLPVRDHLIERERQRHRRLPTGILRRVDCSVVIETTAGFTCATRSEKSGNTARGTVTAGRIDRRPGCAMARPDRAVVASNAAARAVWRRGFKIRIRFSIRVTCRILAHGKRCRSIYLRHG